MHVRRAMKGTGFLWDVVLWAPPLLGDRWASERERWPYSCGNRPAGALVAPDA